MLVVLSGQGRQPICTLMQRMSTGQCTNNSCWSIFVTRKCPLGLTVTSVDHFGSLTSKGATPMSFSVSITRQGTQTRCPYRTQHHHTAQNSYETVDSLFWYPAGGNDRPSMKIWELESSQPYWPQSNGLIERMVGTPKQVLRKLLQNHNECPSV